MTTPSRLSRSSLLAASLLAGCAEERGVLYPAGVDSAVLPDTDRGDTDEDTGVRADCDNPLVRTSPEDGARDVPVGARIEAVLTRAEPDATLRVRQAARDLPGLVEHEDAEARLVFEPIQPVRAVRTYETVVSWSCGTAVVEWSTGNRVQRALLADGTQAAPTGGPDLAGVLDPWLLRLDGLGGGRAEVLLAPAAGVRQDLCSPSTLATGTVSDEGELALSAPTAWIRVEGRRVEVRDVRVQGSVGPMDGRVASLQVAFQARMDAFADALDRDSAEAVCGALPNGCSRCPDGDVLCAEVRVATIPLQDDDAALAPLSADDVSGNPVCP